MTNLQIADLLRNVAAAYELRDQNKNKFKMIAYQRAADAVEHATSELKDLWDEGKAEGVPGIGPSIAKHLGEIFKTGKSKHFEEVMKGLPPKIFKLMKVPGVGPKTALKMIEEGNIPLEVSAELKKIEERPKRHLLPYASVIAAEIINYMSVNKAVKKIDPLGSLRRQASTVGDIDISVATDKPEEVLEFFTKYPKVQKVIEKGEHTASIMVPGGVQVDMMAQEKGSYGSLLQHFTGSKHHNIALREFALKQNLSLSEYGIKKAGKLQSFDNEKDFYRALGLDYIEPELRENMGEIETAKEHRLPNLVELKDVRGDLQIHSSFDIETSHDLGVSSMEQVVNKAKQLEYEYIAFTEHNPSRSKHTHERIINLLKQKEEKVCEKDWGIKVFNSLEIDIMPDGTLPVPEAGLETLDFALVSVHGSFRLPKEDMTKRILSALAHPKVKIFA
ncbi:MAG: PHP domain protein, partial [Candidatus Woesebacteria bacterium GW2011_GWB1_41_10]